MKKYYLLIILVVLLGISSQTQAASAPQLIINDSLKECQMYAPNAREELINGWYNSGARFEDIHDDPEKYCASLGYTFQQHRTDAAVKPIFKAVAITFWIIFAALIYLYYKIFLQVKKRYIIFSLCVLTTAFVLVYIVHPFVIYQISPCASGWAIC